MLISNSNWTEWSTIQGVIARVISKSDEGEARGRFEITSGLEFNLKLICTSEFLKNSQVQINSKLNEKKRMITY